MKEKKMNSKVIFVGLLLAILLSPPIGSAAQGQVHSLSFLEAWQSALKQTPELLMSRARVAEAEAAFKTAHGSLFPQLQASYTGSGSDNALNVFGMKLTQRKATFNDFGAGQFNPLDPTSLFIAPENLNNPGWYDNYQGKLELQIPVFNGGKVRGYLEQARAYLGAAQQGDEMARQQLTLAVLKTYEGVRTANAFVGVAIKTVTAAEAYADLTDKLFARGVVSHNDQLRAQLNLSDVRLRMAEASAYLDKAYDQLRILVGLPDDSSPEVLDVLAVRMPQGTLQDLRLQLLETNPGLLAMGKKLDAVKAEVKIARADSLPHFNVVVSQEWNSPSVDSVGESASMIAGVLSWNLFDFGVRRGKVAQANARSVQQAAELQQARNQLRLQLDSAWRDVKLAAERVKVRELAIAQAEEAERLERLRYEKGVSTMTELLAVQAELDKARSDLVAARYQQIMQRAGLLLALGQLTPDAVSNVTPAGNPG